MEIDHSLNTQQAVRYLEVDAKHIREEIKIDLSTIKDSATYQASTLRSHINHMLMIVSQLCKLQKLPMPDHLGLLEAPGPDTIGHMVTPTSPISRRRSNNHK